MTPSALRIAVVSDLHAYEPAADDEDARPSYLSTDSSDSDLYQNPIAALKALIDDRKLCADLLLCCGDLGDKARPTATRYAWKQVHEIAEALEVSAVLATAGNHDLDSRHRYNDYDARGVLQTLVPSFPLLDEAASNKYWARDYSIVFGAEYRVLLLNSSAYHGGPEAEFQHGRINHNTQAAIRNELERADAKAVNILLSHHHPYKHDDFPAADYSEMKGGDVLIALLATGDYGRWLVVHGHKHYPRLCYAAGGIASPVVFAAGSLSAVLYPELQNRARNQFYMLEFPWAEFAQLQLDLVGRFRAWDWIHSKGWQPATPRSGLPSAGGFGYRADGPVLLRSVLEGLGARPFVSWSEVLRSQPKLEFLTPGDLETLDRRLSREASVELVRNEFGVVLQVARRASG